MQIVLVLDNIRSTHNVGSLFRTADGFGVSKIFLCGVTPDPVDRFGRDRNDIAKVALGAEKIIPWEHVGSTIEAITKLKNHGYRIVALEQAERSISLKDFPTTKKDIALVLGEETQGLVTDILDACDIVVEIPMQGAKESFNVSVAAAIALYEMNRH